MGAIGDIFTLALLDPMINFLVILNNVLFHSFGLAIIAFTIVMIVLFTSSFLSATSISLTSLWPLSKIGVQEGQTFLVIIAPSHKTLKMSP